MSLPTLDHFLATLKQSHLLSDDQLDRLGKRLMRAEGRIDASRVARSLVEGGHITLWQARQLLAGRTTFFLGRYKLLDRIGKGGMGVVFKAQHAMMDRIVALKVMSRALLNNARAHERFAREVKAAAALNHPNIIAAYDADRVGATHFLVMEYVDGHDLNAWLKAFGPLPISLACECAMQAAEGLAHANRRNMVHRDIKPVNMLVAWNHEQRKPVIKILDMGLARFVSESQEDGGITQVGHMVGTPDYVAPEAAENFKAADIRADIFSLGCALFKLITGRLPFPGDNTMEKLLARTRRDAPPLSQHRRGVPEQLEQVVARMLAREPTDRYQTPEEVVAALKPMAASTLGDQDTLDFFEPSRFPDKPTLPQRIEPDQETSIEDFFNDCSASPARDEEPIAELDDEDDSDELMLTPPESRPKPVMAGQGRESTAAAPTREEPYQPGVIEVDPLEELFGAADRSGGGGIDAMMGADPLQDTAHPGTRSVVVRRGFSRRRWDSPLLLIGGGVLLPLLFVGGLMFWSLTRQTGDEALRLANEDYRSGAYSQAILRYGEFLERFPKHAGASSARVHRGLARLRQVVEAGNDWPKALDTAEEVLSEIAPETAFGEARAELAGMLPEIAERLAAEAHEQRRAELLDQAERAATLVQKYVPASLRPAQRMEQVQRLMALTSRELQRSEALAKAIEHIKQAAADNDIAEAYAWRARLVREYPDLENAAELNEAVLEVVRAEQQAVRWNDDRRTASTEALQSGVPRPDYVLVASFRGETTTGAERPLVVQAGGGLLLVNAQNGEVLWHRTLGRAGFLRNRPTHRMPNGDVIVLDHAAARLLRLAADDGTVRWHQTLDGRPVGRPLIRGDRLVVATAEGMLLICNASDGSIRRRIELPHALNVGPAGDRRGEVLWQVAKDSSLFVLSLRDAQCVDCFYIGHRAGAVTVRPMVVGQYLLLHEADRLDQSRLLVMTLRDDGGIAEVVQRLRLAGHLYQEPLVVGNRLLAATDRGAIYAFEIMPERQDEPLRMVATMPPSPRKPMPRFLAARGPELWVAADRLTQFEIQAAQGRLMPRWVEFPGDVFLAQPALVNDHLLHVRRPASHAAVRVAASRADNGAAVWQTEVASSVVHLQPAGPMDTDEISSSVLAVTSGGNLFAVPRPAEAARPEQVIRSTVHLEDTIDWIATSHIVALGDRRWAIVPSEIDTERLLVVEQSDSGFDSRWLDLPDRLGGLPVAFAGRLVIPGSTGQVYVVDPQTGADVVQPFQPEVRIGHDVRWFAALAQSGKELLLADQRGGVYVVGVQREPMPHLAQRSHVVLDTPLASAVVSNDRFACAVDRQDRFVSLTLPDLQTTAQEPLGGRLVKGPEAVGGMVFVEIEPTGFGTRRNETSPPPASDGQSTSDSPHRNPETPGDVANSEPAVPAWRPVNELVCFDPDGTFRWRVEVPPLVRLPLLVGNELVTISRDGFVIRLDRQSGALVAKRPLGILATAALRSGDNALLIGTRHGTLLRVSLP